MKMCDRRGVLARAALVVAAVAVNSSRAGQYTWTPATTGDADFNSAANWNSNAPGTAPGVLSTNSDAVTFATTPPPAQPSLTALTTSISQINLLADGYTFSGNTMLLTAPLQPEINAPGTGGATTFNNNLSLGANQTWTGNLTSSPAWTLNVASIDLAAGTSTSRNLALNGAVNVHVLGGLTISLAGTTAANRNFNITGTGTGDTMTIDGPIVNGNATTPGSLSVALPGTVILNGQNTYTGPTLINNAAAVIAFTSDANLGASPATPTLNVTYNQSGTLRMAANQGTVSWNNNRQIGIRSTPVAIIDIGTSTALTIGVQGGPAVFLGGGGIDKVGTGALIINNANPAITGTISFDAGVLQLGDPLAVGTNTIKWSGGTLQATSGLTLTNPNQFLSASTIGGTAPITFSGAGTLSGTADRTLTFNDSGGVVYSGPITLSTAQPRVNSYGGNGPLLLSGALSEAAGFPATVRITNSAGVTISNPANSYTGGTVIDAAAAVLIVPANNVLSTGPIVLNNGTLRGANGARTLSNNVTIGIAGTKTLDATSGGITFTSPITLASGAGHTMAVLGNATFAGAVGESFVGSGLSLTGSGTLVLAGNDTYTGGTTVTGGTLQLNHLHALGTGALTINGATGTVLLPAGQATALRLPGLAISAGMLEMNDNDLIVDYSGATPAAAIVGYLQSGFNGGAWNGQGIASKTASTDAQQRTALGYADVTNTTFDGQSIPGSAVVVKYTYYGDSDLNGAVDTTDFMRFLDGYAGAGSTWGQGDYTYDGVVDLGNDFNLFLTGYMTQGGTLGALADVINADEQLSAAQKASLLAAVPEPSALGMVAAAGLVALRRRRRA